MAALCLPSKKMLLGTTCMSQSEVLMPMHILPKIVESTIVPVYDKFKAIIKDLFVSHRPLTDNASDASSHSS
jgi:hypothetical protein